MDFVAVVDQVIILLRQRGRMTYRTLQRQFQLDDDALHDLTDELLYTHPEVRDDAGRGLVWTDDAGLAPIATSVPVEPPGQTPLAYTPPYLAEKILTSRSALEGERKQVTVLFADLKGSTELIRDLDPEAAQRLLDPALQHMMDAVHRFEGTVSQVLGDGIMALFGAPLAHEGFVNLLRLKLSSNARIVYLVPSYLLSSPLRVRDCGSALESLPHFLPVVRRGQQMSSRSEVVGDRTIGGQKALRMPR